jgi:hypothetical protein
VRINEAIAAGVDFICSGAAFRSGSHRNMERARRAYPVRSLDPDRTGAGLAWPHSGLRAFFLILRKNSF